MPLATMLPSAPGGWHAGGEGALRDTVGMALGEDDALVLTVRDDIAVALKLGLALLVADVLALPDGDGVKLA